MKKQKQEILSTLIDDELSNNKEILDNLISNEEMKDTWARFHLIGDCLRGNLPKKIDRNFSSNLKKIIANEPSLFFPNKNYKLVKEPIIGFAIAASVAIFAVLGIQRADISPIETTASTVHMKKEIVDSKLDTFSFPGNYVAPANVEEINEYDFLSNQRLNNYLINHSQYRNDLKMNTVLPYARIVNIETED